MSPECSGKANTCLDFVNNHEDAKFLRQLSESVSEVARDMVITTFRLNWLDDSGSDLAVLLGPPVFDLEAGISECFIILSSVVLFILLKRVLILR